MENIHSFRFSSLNDKEWISSHLCTLRTHKYILRIYGPGSESLTLASKNGGFYPAQIFRSHSEVGGKNSLRHIVYDRGPCFEHMDIPFFGRAVMDGRFPVFFEKLFAPGIMKSPDREFMVSVGKCDIFVARYAQDYAAHTGLYLIVGG